MSRRRRDRRGPRPEPLPVTVEIHPDVLGDAVALEAEAARKARVREAEIRGCTVRRRSIDARGGTVRIRAELDLWLRGAPPTPDSLLPTALGPLSATPEVAIVGAGPAGLFCAWALARAGINSVVLERGRKVRARRRDLARLSQAGELDAESNYCFGEGGAGTFSDGKLYTRAHKRGDVREVLEVLARHGAPPEILVDARPHVGTNRLPKVVTSLREHLESAGVRFEFETRVTGLRVEDGRVRGVEAADGRRFEGPKVVVAPGHSAPDVLRFLGEAGAALEAKPFAVGVRIEHAQPLVDRIQYGDLAGHPALGAAYYRLVEQVEGTGVYSFCMCPGGHVVPASTVPGQQVVNGWSPAHRRGRFANSGFVTEVGPAQLAQAGLDPDSPMSGLAYQARLETRAFQSAGGGFKAPAQNLRALVDDRLDSHLPATSYHLGTTPVRMDDVLGPLAPPIREALRRLGERMPGFVDEGAVALGVESRTSSPVRILRDSDSLEALGLPGVFPVGEGTGHAGGIMSAALDGMRAARAIARGRTGTASPAGEGP